MKNKNIQQVKLIIIAVIVLMSASYVSAFGPTAPAPGNNVGGLIDQSSVNQRKGSLSNTPGILLDVDDSSNLNDVLSMNNLSVFIDMNINGSAYVNSLMTTGRVCADPVGRIINCYAFLIES
jgi:hypothetical protein